MRFQCRESFTGKRGNVRIAGTARLFKQRHGFIMRGEHVLHVIHIEFIACNKVCVARYRGSSALLGLRAARCRPIQNLIDPFTQS
jgi:hypothetical protein